jgi:uncharacterized protein (DUF305 family)
MLGVNLALSLAAMYVVMFLMIDGWRDFRHNLNTLYMALAMVAPMGAIMLATMGRMYPKRTLNTGILVGLGVLLVIAIAGVRTQTPIGDRQFIASMIPHHSGAILMCREATLTDPALVELCREIERAQREEIRRMEAIEARGIR